MQSLASANRVLDAIEQKLQILARHPEMGQLRHDLHSNLRCFPVGKYDYVIFYRPLDYGIEVVRVHSSRDTPRVFRTGEQ
jgi:plasmid stabilization system protein ParE